MRTAKEMRQIEEIRKNFNKLKHEQEKFENLQIVLSYLEYRLRRYCSYIKYEEKTEEEWKIPFVETHGTKVEKDYIVNKADLIGELLKLGYTCEIISEENTLRISY